MRWLLVLPVVAIVVGMPIGMALAMWFSRREANALAGQRDGLQTRYDILVGHMLQMRRDGFTLAKPAAVREPKDEEGEALKFAEQQLIQRRDDASFIERATKKIMNDNPRLSQAQARAEAIRLRRGVTDEDPPA